ncbi:MAG: glycoside hydrolase 5 family protein [Armatimonadota bacterium]
MKKVIATAVSVLLLAMACAGAHADDLLFRDMCWTDNTGSNNNINYLSSNRFYGGEAGSMGSYAEFPSTASGTWDACTHVSDPSYPGMLITQLTKNAAAPSCVYLRLGSNITHSTSVRIQGTTWPNINNVASSGGPLTSWITFGNSDSTYVGFSSGGVMTLRLERNGAYVIKKNNWTTSVTSGTLSGFTAGDPIDFQIDIDVPNWNGSLGTVNIYLNGTHVLTNYSIGFNGNYVFFGNVWRDYIANSGDTSVTAWSKIEVWDTTEEDGLLLRDNAWTEYANSNDIKYATSQRYYGSQAGALSNYAEFPSTASGTWDVCTHVGDSTYPVKLITQLTKDAAAPSCVYYRLGSNATYSNNVSIRGTTWPNMNNIASSGGSLASWITFGNSDSTYAGFSSGGAMTLRLERNGAYMIRKNNWATLVTSGTLSGFTAGDPIDFQIDIDVPNWTGGAGTVNIYLNGTHVLTNYSIGFNGNYVFFGAVWRDYIATSGYTSVTGWSNIEVWDITPHTFATVSASGTDIMMGASPLRLLSFNKCNLFMNYLLDGQTGYSIQDSLDSLSLAASNDFGVLRYFASGFYPIEMADWRNYWSTDSADYWDLMDQLVANAASEGIKLIPIINVNLWLYPDMTYYFGPYREYALDFVADKYSMSRAMFERYIYEIVSRYRDNPTVLWWEFGNEYTNKVDLEFVRTDPWYYLNNTSKGTPASRSKALDDFLTADLIGFYKDSATLIRAIDQCHLISSGDSIPRTSAQHLRLAEGLGDWTLDSPSEFQTFLGDTTPDPIDLISIHFYPGDGNLRWGNTDTTSAVALDQIKTCCDNIGKPVYIGEFGSGNEFVDYPLPSGSADSVDGYTYISNVISKVIANEYPYAMVWQWDTGVPYTWWTDINPTTCPDLVNLMQTTNSNSW